MSDFKISEEKAISEAKAKVRRHAIIAAAAGLLFGAICPSLPTHWQLPCVVAAKLLAVTCGAR